MADTGSVLAQVMREAGPRLAAFGFVLTGSQSESEELVQEAIVKTFVRRPRLADAPSAEQYVRLTMRTLTIDRARKQARWHRVAPSQAQPAHAPEQVTAISTRVAVEKALTGLAPQQRVAVALRYWDDMTVPEVAQAMHVRPGTVKRYLHDAAAALRPLLGDHTEPDEGDDVRIVGFGGRRR